MMAKGMTFKWKIPPNELVGKVEVSINHALDDTSIDIVNDIVVSLSIGQENGPSKPGEPPHTLTGEMKRSISWDVPRHLMRRVGSGIGKGHPMAIGYPAFLEFGTKPHRLKSGEQGGEILPRPWLRPAMIRNRHLLAAYCKKFLGYAFRKGSFA